MTRPVTIFKRGKPNVVDGRYQYEKIEGTKGTFHQFGVNYDEFETGPGMFTTAIVELQDGTMRNVEVELIRFDDVVDEKQKNASLSIAQAYRRTFGGWDTV